MPMRHVYGVQILNIQLENNNLKKIQNFNFRMCGMLIYAKC